MKRVSILLGFLLATTLPLFAEHIVPENARKAAAAFLRNNGVKTMQLDDISKAVGFPNLYIFNSESGFVVMSSDDRVQPILGYSLTEAFETENMPENLKWWLQGYNDQIQDIVEQQLPGNASAQTEWQKLESGTMDKMSNEVIVEPLITTLWDQKNPYNALCPTASGGPGGHVYAGCVATAMAQVMNYWQYPITGDSTHSYTHGTYGELTVDFGATTYDWANMPTSLSINSPQVSINAVATLIYHCGVSVDMNYGKSSSGTWSGNVPSALIDFFRYAPSATYISRDAYEDAQWIAFLKTELDEGRPLNYSGSNTDSGHAFVCDGYRSDDYFHFNWGWSGSKDGYFTIGALSPGGGGSGSGSNTYNLSNAVIAWIEPIYDLTTPTLSATISSNVVTLTWNNIPEADSYDVYKDNVKIAADLTTLSFLDNTVSFGQHPEYYIRAKSSTGKSNPSNRVALTATYQNRIPQHPTASISVSDNSVNLSWTAPQSQSMDMYYGNGQIDSYFGSGLEEGTYWGQCYPTPVIGAFDGMAIDHVSIYLGFTGNYSLFLYKDGVTSEANLLASKSFSSTYGWNDIVLDDAIPLDTTKDLWIVFHAGKDIPYPAYIGYYDGDYREHAHYIWQNFSENICYDMYPDVSWPIKVHLTDGDFAYNIYRNDTLVAAQQANNSYQDVNLFDGTHEYAITATANGWESEASDIVSIAYATEHQILGTATITDNLTLSGHNRYVVGPNATLNLTGTITNPDPANLVIEDGGQLIHANSAVNATLKKTVNAYSTEDGVNNGWYTLASPVDELDVDVATIGDYDLYIYDEFTHYWLNQKKADNHITTFDEGKGFLYANADSQSLAFAGSMKATDEQVSLTLSCQSDNERLKGFHLVGNPFTDHLNFGDINLGGTALSTYYVVEGGSQLEVRTLAETPIKPGQGFLVQATTDGQSLEFNPTTKEQTKAKPAYIGITVGDDRFTDHTYVQFSEGNALRKMSLSDNTTRLSVRHNGADYAAITLSQAEPELSLLFKATHNGTYTLQVNVVNLDMDYLHLIDNLAGTDTDLLTSPSYSFEASPSDYESRFRLVFDENLIGNPSGDEVHPADDAVQILDMTGRIVATDRNALLAPGIYLLRTMNGNCTSTLKIIIK